MSKSYQNQAGTGDLTESLQLHAIALTVKALVATHPSPDHLRKAMLDLFAQFQSTAVVLSLSESQRASVRDMFCELLPLSPRKEQ